MNMLGHYVQITLRGFRRNKLPTIVNLLGLGLGLMGFVAAYLVSQDFLSVGERYPTAGRVHIITQGISGTGVGPNLSFEALPITGASVARYVAADLPEIEAIARAPTQPAEHAVAAGTAKAYQRVTFVDPDYLDIFPEPIVGAAGGNALEQPLSAVISPTAARAFFGDFSPVGKPLRLEGAVDVTVTGVFAEQPVDQLGNQLDVLASMDTRLALQRAESGTDAEQAGQPDEWFPRDIITFVLLPEDGSLTLPELERYLAGFAERHIGPDVDGDVAMTFGTLPLAQLVNALVATLAGGAIGISMTSLILLIGVLILAMSCLNYANLAAAQAFMRAKHVGLLKVLGAKRGHVLVQSLVEAAVLAAGALVLALGVAAVLVPFANSAFGMTMRLPFASSPSLWALLVALVVGVGIVAGGYPALLLARVRPVQALRAGSARGGPSAIRMLLVGTQFTVASMLLILVLVMFGHNREMRQLGVEGTGDPVVVIDSKLPDGEATREAFAAALKSHPAIAAVSATGLPPWSLAAFDAATLSRTDGSQGTGTVFMLNDVAYDYFETMGAKLIAGRTFSRDRGEDLFFWGETPADNASRALRMVVDAQVASRFGWQDPAAAVGQTVYRRWDNFSRPVEIIGVVEDRPYKLVTLGMASATVYFLQPNDTSIHLVRIDGTDTAAALAHIDRTWNELAPDIPIKRSLMEEEFEEAYTVFEIFNGVFAGLALFAILVACIGLFGAATYATSRRVHEIGVRKTLGASSRGILRMLLWDFSKPVVVANLIAWPIGFLAMQVYLSLFVFRAGASAAPFIGSLSITLLVAWLAVSAQASRAARVRPAQVLRQE